MPQSGKLRFIIHDAHNKGVTAIASTSNSKRIISGGGEGEVRVWDVNAKEYKMTRAMKEHKGFYFTHLIDFMTLNYYKRRVFTVLLKIQRFYY